VSFIKINLLPILWTMLIMVLCFSPSSKLPDSPFLGFDKIVHAVLFFVLAFLWINGFNKQTQYSFLHKYPKLMGIVLCIIYGILIELFQGYFRRTGEWDDVIANTFGCFLAVIFYNLFQKYWTKSFRI